MAASPEYLRRLARLGVAMRLRDIEEEIAEILREFPELQEESPEAPRRGARHTADGATRRRRPRRRMTTAQRRAVQVRMKKYWAERRRQASTG